MHNKVNVNAGDGEKECQVKMIENINGIGTPPPPMEKTE